MYKYERDDFEVHTNPTVINTLNFDVSLSDGFAIWGGLDDLRREIALGGKNLLVGLLAAKIGLYSRNDIVLFDEMSELMGGDVHELVWGLLQEFDGPDPAKHLWQSDDSGIYRLHH